MNRSRYAVSGWLFAVLLVVGLLGFGCVDMEVDDERPYPLNPYDYDYPQDELPPPPWEHPEDFPVVTVDEPADGAFVTPGSVTVSGTYAGPETESFLLNGEPLTLTGNAFSGSVLIGPDDVLVPITVSAKTKDQIVGADAVTVINGAPAAPDALVGNAFFADLENSGLAAISGLLSNALDGIDLTGAMDAKALFDFETATIGNLDILLRAKDEGFLFEILAGDVEFLIKMALGDLSLELDGLFISVLTDISVDGNGHYVLDVINSEVALAHWQSDLPFVPDNVENILDLLTELLLPALVDVLIDGPITDLLNQLLGGLDIQITSDTLVYSVIPSMVDATDRNMVLGFDTQAELLEVFDDDFQPEGFYSTASTPPVFEEKTPVADKPYGIGIALNDDMLNQLFYSLCATGTLNFELTDPMITAELLSILFFSFEDIEPVDAPVVIELSPSIAPVFWGDAGNRVMHMSLVGFTGRIMVDRGAALGRWEAMSLGIDIGAPLSIVVNDDDSFSLKLDEMAIAVRILHNPVGQRNVENMNRMLTELFQNVVPDLLGALLEDMKITIPDIEGLSVTIPDLSLFGPNDDYLGAFVGLEY